MSEHKFPYEWTLKDAKFTKDKGTVFSCFACGGGSTMGYKLAGFDVLGCNEIDPKMAECYVANHNPKYCYIEPIQTFKLRDDLPQELYELDILDGSPPCSSFSMAGNREKDWGKDKKFREGQAEQVLDTLFFDFIDLAKKLQPKVVVAENVKGLLLGEAQKYVAKILEAFAEAGYYVDYSLLNAAKMGVPQRRERVFFYAIRKDLYVGGFSDLFGTKPALDLLFQEAIITFAETKSLGCDNPISGAVKALWNKRLPGDLDLSFANGRENGKPNTYFSSVYIYNDKIAPTITASDTCILFDEARYRNKAEFLSGGSFPKDYRFCSSKARYIIGMSVPPVMTAQIATRIYEQWLSKL